MYLISNIELEKSLKKLKKFNRLLGIKSEFEAEGSSIDDVSRLKILSTKFNTKLYVKIGGVEAINDIYKCVELEVDGIIAPMVETKFGLFKFVQSINALKLKKNPELAINIETKSGYKNIDEIIKFSIGKINNITIGRSDLSSSYFNKNLSQNSQEITKIILNLSKKIKRLPIRLTVGGGVNKKTIEIFKKIKIHEHVDKIETRKIILSSKHMLKKGALDNCINFETNYILNKKEINDLKMKSEINRISRLKTRK